MNYCLAVVYCACKHECTLSGVGVAMMLSVSASRVQSVRILWCWYRKIVLVRADFNPVHWSCFVHLVGMHLVTVILFVIVVTCDYCCDTTPSATLTWFKY